MLFDAESPKMVEFATVVILPIAGWLVKKQLDINNQVRDNTSQIGSQKDSIDHMRTRIDAIYDHLIGEK